jgi:putative serine protease PepD
MLQSAVSLALFLGVRAQFTGPEVATINNLRPAIAYIKQAGVTYGAAAFITKDGYAITHQLTLGGGATELVTGSGEKLAFVPIHKDTPSQLVLIKTVKAPSKVETVSWADDSDGGRGMILAVLPTGTVRAEITSSERIGVDEKSRRAVPMNEVRIEQTPVAIGGALLFSGKGRLIGSIAATLAVSQVAPSQNQGQNQGQNQSQSRTGIVASLNAKSVAPLGPAGLVVGYTPTWEVTKRAMAGFLTPGHKAPTAMLGVLIVNSLGGVSVQQVDVDSPAAQAGIKVGDVISDIGGKKIRDQIDFARMTYDFQPGDKVAIQIQRGSEKLTVEATLGAQTTQLAERRLASIEATLAPDKY